MFAGAWLYFFIPASRAEAHGWRTITWAIFGNDEDGVYGDRIAPGVQPPFGSDQPKTFRQFLRWWTRNPGHNISFHVLLRPVVNPIRVVTTKPLELRFRPFFLRVGVPGTRASLFIGWREDTPIPGAWGKFGPGGGKWDLGCKDLS